MNENFNDFDWDKLASELSFSEIQKLSPILRIPTVPSMYSLDKKLFYFSSIGDYARTNKEEELNDCFNRIKDSYSSIVKKEKINYGKIYIAYKDFFKVCELLSNLSDTPEQYSAPDIILDS